MKTTSATSSRRSFFKKATLGGLSLGSLIHASAAESVAYATQNVNRNSSPSDLKITDMRFAEVVGAPMRCPLIRIDTNQIAQVVTNLCDNACRHNFQATEKSECQIKIEENEHNQTIFLEVIDHGKGVPESDIDSIFEPFFTTEEKGSGLGLYLSRELCEINQANLSYRRENNTSIFRIEFSHYQRMS